MCATQKYRILFLLAGVLLAGNAQAQEKPDPADIDFPTIGSPSSSLATAVPNAPPAPETEPAVAPAATTPEAPKTTAVTVTTIPAPDVSAISEPKDIASLKIAEPQTPVIPDLPDIPTPLLHFADFLPFGLATDSGGDAATVANAPAVAASKQLTGVLPVPFDREQASSTASLPANATSTPSLATQSLPYLGIASSPVQQNESLPSVSAPVFGQATTPISAPQPIFVYGTPSTPIENRVSAPTFGSPSTPVTVPQSSPVFGRASTPVSTILGTPNFGLPSTPVNTTPSTPHGFTSTPRSSPVFGNASSPTSPPNFGPPSTPRGSGTSR